MDADAKLDAALGRKTSVTFGHAVLHLDRAANGIDHAADSMMLPSPVRLTIDRDVRRWSGRLDRFGGPVAVRASVPRRSRQVCYIRPRRPRELPRVSGSPFNAKLVRRWKECFKARYRVIRLASGYARSTQRAAGAWAVGETRTRLPAGPRWAKTNNLIAGASFLGASHPFQSSRICCHGWSITSRSGSARRLSRSEVPGSPVFPGQ